MFFYRGEKIDDFVCKPSQVNILTRKLGNYRNLGWPAAWELEEEIKRAELGIEVRGAIGEATYVATPVSVYASL